MIDFIHTDIAAITYAHRLKIYVLFRVRENVDRKGISVVNHGAITYCQRLNVLPLFADYNRIGTTLAIGPTFVKNVVGVSVAAFSVLYRGIVTVFPLSVD
jgi:hypothetical protein